jgi:hypothetical protein
MRLVCCGHCAAAIAINTNTSKPRKKQQLPMCFDERMQKRFDFFF